MRSNLFKQSRWPDLVRSTSFHLRQKFQRTRLGLRFSERRLLLALGDLFMLNGALLVYLLARAKLSLVDDSFWVQVRWFAVFMGLWLGATIFSDIYDLSRAARAIESATYTAGTAVFVSGLYLLIPYLTPTLPNRRLHIFLLPLLVMLFIIMWRVLYATLFSQPTFQRHVLIIGAGQSGQTLAQTLLTGLSRQRGTTIYNIIGFIDDESGKQSQVIEGIPVLGTRDDLVKLVQKLRPDELIVAITHAHLIHPSLFKAVLDCRESGIPITTMAYLYENLMGRVPVKHAGNDLQVVLPIDRPASYRLYMAVRRCFELIVALAGCLLTLVLLPLIWLANHLTSPGDLFYRQERVGDGGKVFEVIKFRSMIMNAEQNTGVTWAQTHDARVTPIGRLLRQARIDEIPQFWNVLKGEMSLIGPRPERPSIINQLEREIPFYRVRHAVKPGITGWAQVCYRYGSSVDDALIKLEYDLYYIKHQGLYLDLLILAKTARVILGLQGQ